MDKKYIVVNFNVSEQAREYINKNQDIFKELVLSDEWNIYKKKLYSIEFEKQQEAKRLFYSNPISKIKPKSRNLIKYLSC